MQPHVATTAQEQTGQWFATTHWTTVVAAGNRDSPQAAAALELLCLRYRPPIYTFIRRRGYGPADAQDLTQEFFARFLEGQSLQTADSAKGKFRTLLLTAVSRFLVNAWDRTQAQKRGGGVRHISLDEKTADEHARFEPAHYATPETLFERRWAETVLEAVLGRLRAEFTAVGQVDRFEVLKPFLASEKNVPSGAEIAIKLSITESSAYSAISRLRQRYGELLRAEIAETVSHPAEIDDELRHLLRALSG